MSQTIRDLLTLAMSTGAGVIVYAVMDFIIKLFEPTQPLTARAKFYTSMALAFLVPGGAYGLAVMLGWQTFDPVGVLGAIGTGFIVSKTIHFEDQSSKQSRKAERMVEYTSERRLEKLKTGQPVTLRGDVAAGEPLVFGGDGTVRAARPGEPPQAVSLNPVKPNDEDGTLLDG